MQGGFDWTSIAASAVSAIISTGACALVGGYVRARFEAFENLMDKKFAESRTALLDEMNGKYLRTREQLKDNERFSERLDDHGNRLNKYAERIHSLELRSAGE
jgi:coenzyme F420-reducing hydrogenase gamma subunit